MQPYYFPYVGYFQLISAVDKFIVFDDVNYIKKGWINRNRILLNGAAYVFTLPIQKASQNRLINLIELNSQERWIKKFYLSIDHAYKHSANYSEVLSLIKEIHSFSNNNLSAFLTNSIKMICTYLDIKTEIVSSSTIYDNTGLKGQDRIIDICCKEGANIYINPIGGCDLYSCEEFRKKGIELKFLQTLEHFYYQPSGVFVPFLSIIDLLFNCRQKDLKTIINKSYKLV